MRLNTLLAATAAVAITASAAHAENLRIGASLPITGGLSVSGEKHKRGYELCTKLINEAGGILGRQVELIVSDNRSDTATAINQYERFINVDKVEAVYGTFSSRLTFPVASILSKYNMVHAIPSGGALRIYEQGYKNLFYFQVNAAEYTGKDVAAVIKQLIPAGEAPKSVAVVSADDFFANAIEAGLLGQKVKDPATDKEIADLAPGYLADAGIEVLMKEKWPEEGFNDWLNLANSVKRSGAEMVIGLTASAEEAVQLTRSLKTVGATPKLVYLSQGAQTEFIEGVGKEAADGVLIHTTWHKDVPFESTLAGKPFNNADFVKAFTAEYSVEPDEDSAIPFAVCQGIEQAILGAGTTDNAKMGEWLHARTKEDPVRTVLGRFSWDDVGLPVEKSHIMTQWQDGSLKFVYPTGEFEGVSPFSYPKNGF
ncbi:MULTISPECIES: amino acid ABC transporter substrate-binding protein [unclassified Shinella]|jgi:branched-chain amino acid transport system substrate-binding protein|uniref:amino acid ABC transporter substrate-binding protein n=1 Tax=unclassified Shinella TaxID=2643062 RepID=UPI0003C56252|nr:MULTISPECIES: amino acid ABC transporter substrate-binding protein [unclassified Shinella]EYR77428.1 ABC-type branched-chain amino acid transport system periplasmic component [Shinella sp. DD12]KNY15708.1 branched-chain amino acid ABC transporter substrate-binding protein [Shinella sp. SUS2]KOC75899.1 branched-chain amino acid ABC transporter substrate-binding protein [Shinella sp. GWS1]MCO5151090.1 amino acid ABC transporter substrate-binding protein [Shinella sp.]MDC7265939.1 amino acid A